MKKNITEAIKSKIVTIGLDIAKNSFSVHGFDEAGNSVLTKDLRRGQVLMFFWTLEPCRVGLEACASAHYWARELIKLGITVTVHSIILALRWRYGDSAFYYFETLQLKNGTISRPARCWVG